MTHRPPAASMAQTASASERWLRTVCTFAPVTLRLLTGRTSSRVARGRYTSDGRPASPPETCLTKGNHSDVADRGQSPGGLRAGRPDLAGAGDHLPRVRRDRARSLRPWHAGYTRAVTWIVAPLMLGQVVLLAWLAVVRPSRFVLLAAAMVAVAWIATFALAVPAHDTL